jgi:hypothetical protein
MDKLPQSLINALTEHNIIPFIGAGVSMSIKNKESKRVFPSWEELLENAAKKLDSECKEIDATLVKSFIKKKDYHQAAKYAYEGLNGGLWKAFIEQQFDPNLSTLEQTSAELPKAIWKLSNQLITLNYDRILTWAHPEPAQVSLIHNKALANLPSMFSKKVKPIVWHLHGHIDNTAELILTPDSYAKLYPTSNNTKKEYESALEALKDVIRHRNLLFIGCSLEDAELLAEIHKQQTLFAGNTGPHYALVRKANEIEIEAKLKGTNIQVLTYEDFGQPLLAYLAKLASYVGKKSVIESIDSTEQVENSAVINNTHLTFQPKAVFLTAKPLGSNEDYSTVKKELQKLPYIDEFEFSIERLQSLTDYEYIFIATNVVKNKLVIEDEHLCFDKITFSELNENFHEAVKGVYLFVDELPTEESLSAVTFPLMILPREENQKISPLLKNFVFQLFKKNSLAFFEQGSRICNGSKFVLGIFDGADKNVFYNHIVTQLPRVIDKTKVKQFIGRKEDLTYLSQKISNLDQDNGFITIKGSGGLGKTTLIKKLAVEFALRGRYQGGIEFVDCEPINSYTKFKHNIAKVFNLEQAIDLEKHLQEYADHQPRLIILDNFEPLLHVPETEQIKNLLSFMAEFASIVITSREYLQLDGELEYTLRQMTLDEAFELFATSKKLKKRRMTDKEIQFVRDDIIDGLLAKNPLAIRIITDTMPLGKKFKTLKYELENDFFNKITEEDLALFDNATDAHIDRKKSLYGSILYSYKSLSEPERKAFEQLSLFPDGIDMESFKRLAAHSKNKSTSKTTKAIISDKILTSLQNKSLVETNQSNIQLQSIIGRFSQAMLDKRPAQTEFFNAVFNYNFKLVDVLTDMTASGDAEKSQFALSMFDLYQNNILKTVLYLHKLEQKDSNIFTFLDYCSRLFVSVCSHTDFIVALDNHVDLFKSEAKIAYMSLLIFSRYYDGKFDSAYAALQSLSPQSEVEINDSDTHIKRFPHFIANIIYEMEGYALDSAASSLKNNDINAGFYVDSLFLIGELDEEYLVCCKKSHVFHQASYYLNKLSLSEIELFINQIHEKDHIELCQNSYIRSMLKPYSVEEIAPLIVVNPFTQGLKYLMMAFGESDINQAENYYQQALPCLTHIKYYYVEALLHYARFLKLQQLDNYHTIYDQGFELSKKHHYRYLQYCFEELENPTCFLYDSKKYPLPDGIDFSDYITKLIKNNLK